MIAKSLQQVKCLPTISTFDGRQFSVDLAGLVTGRREPHEPPQDEQVRAAIAFFELAIEEGAIQKTFTVNSYRCKYRIEKLVGGYCSNGATILGASVVGIPIKKTPWDGLNCYFPINKRWYHRFVDQVQFGRLRLFSERMEVGR